MQDSRVRATCRRTTRRSGMWTASLAVAAALLSAKGAPAGTHEVIARIFVFDPADLTIAAGDSVRWVWESGTHTVTEGPGCLPEEPVFNATLDPAHPTFTYGFPDVGTVDYFCVPHCAFQDMRGVIRVLPPADVPPPAALPSALEPPEPNPLRDASWIAYRLPRQTRASLDVLDSGGRIVRPLFHGDANAGFHELLWDGTGADGERLPSGVYWLRLTAGDVRASRTVLVLR